MNTSITHKLIILVIALVLIGFLTYNFFTVPPTIPIVPGGKAHSEIVGADILALVKKLNAISFDSSLFSSNSFTFLRDFSVSLIPEPQGRPNPFAPIGQ